MSKPFENIAISLSGGGYRASAFHLGALSYLDNLVFEDQSVLQRVKVISTISGGTFTGVGYVLALAQGKNFKACFHKLYHLLEDDPLVVEGLQMINHTNKWRAPEKNKNIINAFSEVYQAKYCDDEHLALLLKAPLGHLDEFCFNATDLFNSLPFRFQKTGKMGNGKMNISDEVAEEIRLGDIMAASSCFPGGFEPLAFPKDFIRAQNSPLAEYWKEQGYPENIALMDGGILDNQGIESVVLANNRRKKEDKIGTYIISDVSSRNALPFKFEVKKKAGILGSLTLNIASIILVVLAVLGILGSWWFWDSSRVMLILSVLVTLVSGVLLTGIFSLQYFLDNAIVDTVDEKSETPAILSNLEIVAKTPLVLLWRLMAVRIFSLTDITSNTFMNRIRTLQFNNLFNDEDWKHILICNNIYSLFTDYKTVKTIPEPSTAMLTTAKLAAQMPTALWFTAKEQQEKMLDKLIIAGQINLCFQLLHYFEDEKETFPPNMRSALAKLEETIMGDYLKFKADEKWLINSLTAGA